MGMTIDEIEQWEKKNKTVKVLEEKWLLAQETMRKYQQIQKVVEDYDKGVLEENDGVYAFKQIRKVIEDGNNN